MGRLRGNYLDVIDRDEGDAELAGRGGLGLLTPDRSKAAKWSRSTQRPRPSGEVTLRPVRGDRRYPGRRGTGGARRTGGGRPGSGRAGGLRGRGRSARPGGGPGGRRGGSRGRNLPGGGRRRSGGSGSRGRNRSGAGFASPRCRATAALAPDRGPAADLAAHVAEDDPLAAPLVAPRQFLGRDEQVVADLEPDRPADRREQDQPGQAGDEEPARAGAPARAAQPRTASAVASASTSARPGVGSR